MWVSKPTSLPGASRPLALAQGVTGQVVSIAHSDTIASFPLDAGKITWSEGTLYGWCCVESAEDFGRLWERRLREPPCFSAHSRALNTKKFAQLVN